MFRMFFVVLGFLALCLIATAQPSYASSAPTANGPPPAHPEPGPTHDFGDNDPNVLVAVGDSITVGVPFVAPEQTYPAQLQGMLGRTVINAGVGGARSYHGVQSIDATLRRYKPGYVLIMYGTNDVMERSADEIAGNLLTIARIARENKTIPILSTVTPVDGPKIARKRWIIWLNEAILSRATESGYLVADVAEDLGWDGRYLFDDGLHIDSAGMAVIARSFYEKVLEAEGKHGGGGGGCVLRPDADFNADLLLLFLTCLLILGFRFSGSKQA